MSTPVRTVLAASVLAATLVLSACTAGGSKPTPSPSYQTETVTLGDLATTEKWGGVLSYDNPFYVVFQEEQAATSNARGDTTAVTVSGGMVTGVAAPGTVLHSGDVMYRVDNVPVVFLEGSAVLWRDLTVGSSGDDIAAVEKALRALGYDPSGTVTVDSSYTSLTRAMVKRFQASEGLDETGEFAFRSAIMRPGPVVVVDVSVSVGDEVYAGDVIMTVADTTRAVSFSIDPDQRPLVAVGDEVTVRLPNGDNVPATVSVIASALDADGETYAVTAVVTGEVTESGDRLDVTVSLPVLLEHDVLLVSPSAIIVRDDIGPAVEVLSDGSVTIVPIEILATSGQLTAVASDGLTEGDVVIVP